MSYGVFEAAATDGHEEEVVAQRRNASINAAVFDVKDTFGDFICAASDKDDFKDRIALVKNDMMSKVAETLMPVPGVMRRVEGALKDAWREKQADVSFEGWALEEVSGSEGIEYYAVINKTTGQEVDRVYPYRTDSDGLWEPLTVTEQEAELDRIVDDWGDPRYSKKAYQTTDSGFFDKKNEKEAAAFRDVEPLDGGIWNIETWDSTMTAQVTSRANGGFDYEIYDGQGNFMDGETVSSLDQAIASAKAGIEYYEDLTAADLDPNEEELFTEQEW